MDLPKFLMISPDKELNKCILNKCNTNLSFCSNLQGLATTIYQCKN